MNITQVCLTAICRACYRYLQITTSVVDYVWYILYCARFCSQYFTVVQIGLKSVLYISELGFMIIETIKRSQWSLVLPVHALSSALGTCVVAPLHSVGILMCSRKCWFCELLLIINKTPVCNFFRKRGNMLLRKPSTCLIPGQNFTWRTWRRSTRLVTGLWFCLP